MKKSVFFTFLVKTSEIILIIFISLQKMDLDILKIASETNNRKSLKNYTHDSKLKNSVCGDEVHIKLIMKKNKIIDFSHEGNSCIYCQASASLLSEVSINKEKIKIDNLCFDAESYFNGNSEKIRKKSKKFKKLFNKKNLSRKECILLPFKTFKKL